MTDQLKRKWFTPRKLFAVAVCVVIGWAAIFGPKMYLESKANARRKREVEAVGGYYSLHGTSKGFVRELRNALPISVKRRFRVSKPKYLTVVLNNTEVDDEWIEKKLVDLPEEVLVSLKFSGTKITDRSLCELCEDRKVIDLNVSRTGVSDDCLPELLAMKSLVWVEVAQTKISPEGVCKLLDLPTLKGLLIDREQLTEEVLEKLNESPNVKSLTLEHLDDQSIIRAQQLKHVSNLFLRYFDDALIPHLMKFKHMSQVHIQHGIISQTSMNQLWFRRPVNVKYSNSTLVIVDDKASLDRP